MIYTAIEYSKAFTFKGKRVSVATIIRRCGKGMLPKGHNPQKKKVGKNGAWMIEVNEK